MLDKDYKSLFEKIKPDDDLIEKTKINMQKERNEMSLKEGKRKSDRSSYTKYASIAAMLVLFSIAIYAMIENGKPEIPVASNDVPGTAVETPEAQDTPLLYSKLTFADSVDIEAPQAIESAPGKIAAFTEDLLSFSNAVIKGTVVRIRFNEFKYTLDAGTVDKSDDVQGFKQSVIYEVRVDKIYYSNLSFEVGDVIIIENDLYTYTSLENSLVKLSTNRQYILPIDESEGDVEYLESNLSIVYPFAPQIEITADGEYLFQEHWTSLLNDKTKNVIMDIGEKDGNFSEHMKLRDDEGFEEDFQSLTDLYCK